MGKTNIEQRPQNANLISRTCARSMQIFLHRPSTFLPPKEAQGKVRQSQGRAAANNFAFSRADFRVHRDPLDHLSVKLYTTISTK